MSNLSFRQLKNILSAAIVLLCAFGVNAQKNRTHTNESNPAMAFELTDEGLNLTCRSGCAWTDLSFTLTPGQTTIVTEYGMSDDKAEVNDPKLTDFAFSVKMNKHRDVTIKSLKGMSFKKIRFDEQEDNIVVKTK